LLGVCLTWSEEQLDEPARRGKLGRLKVGSGKARPPRRWIRPEDVEPNVMGNNDALGLLGFH
jgi:hypothetical protein